MLYEQNGDIVERLQYSSALDGRTSLICGSRDGNIYIRGAEPDLPAHINCRSIYIPVIDGLDIESTRPFVADTRTRKEREIDFRVLKRENGTTIKQEREAWKKKAIGQVSDKTTFNKWLGDQPVGFQKEYLGKTRYNLWKKGDIKLNRFTDPLGTNYTIDELYKIDSGAFKSAGIAKPK
jgi:hypothetical protein